MCGSSRYFPTGCCGYRSRYGAELGYNSLYSPYGLRSPYLYGALYDYPLYGRYASLGYGVGPYSSLYYGGLYI